jgi:hypothetical protein
MQTMTCHVALHSYQVGGGVRGGDMADPDRAPEPPAVKVGAMPCGMQICPRTARALL